MPSGSAIEYYEICKAAQLLLRWSSILGICYGLLKWQYEYRHTVKNLKGSIFYIPYRIDSKKSVY